MTDAAIAAVDPAARREMLAAQVKAAGSVILPHLEHWNYGACSRHETPRPDCEYRECGGDLFDHQNVGVAWLYLRKKGLLADAPGAGKTSQILALMCLLKQQKELPPRAVIVVNTPAVTQWAAEAARFAPGLGVAHVPAGMPKKDRIATYSGNWEVLIVGHHMALRDQKILVTLAPGMVVTDDVDPLLNHGTRTHKMLVDLCHRAERVVVMNASSVQTKPQQLHASMVPIGGRAIWGSLPSFERRYLRLEWDEIRVKGGKKVKVSKFVGLKNAEELRARLGPWVIRRTYDDLTDIRMPELMPPTNVWLELHPAQRAKYDELRKGVLEIQRKSGTKIKHTTALTMITYGQQVCAGLPALGEDDGPQASVKLDWVINRLMGTWEKEKIVVFIRNIGNVRALQARLASVGIGFATIWGEDKDAGARQGEVTRFWEDPNCRVMIGTSAIERSLNLQNASIIVNLDTMLNPERMKQLLGRVRRAGSAHSHVFQFNLLAVDTQESRYLDVLRKREAVNSYIWDESQELYEALSAEDLLKLIRP